MLRPPGTGGDAPIGTRDQLQQTEQASARLGRRFDFGHQQPSGGIPPCPQPPQPDGIGIAERRVEEEDREVKPFGHNLTV